MQVDQWPIENVKPYAKNPRRNDDAVEKVANSIREFGFKQPIVVDADGVVIVGHTRLKAAQMLGMTEVPVTVASDLTPNQADAYRLADNKVAEFSDWDWDMLKDELEDIDWLDVNMGEFGFKLDDDVDFDIESENQSTKTNVRCTLFFESVVDYKVVEKDLASFAEEIGAELSVSMA